MRKILKGMDIAEIKKRPGIQTIYRDIRDDLEKVEQRLQHFTQSPNEIISEISTYLFQNAGKRIRPALLILCAKLCGYTGQEHIVMSSLVETIHTASLLHDDIIDNSEFRRGKASVHARWGPNITVLLGDYLYIRTIGTALQSKHREIVEILTEISSRMIEGELNEYAVSWSLDMTEEDYLDIIHKKTASLFSASCQIGGILADAPSDRKDLLAEFGANLGMTFQIIDDLLDYTGDERTLGKPVLSDLREGRITLPLIYTLNNDGAKNRKRIEKLLSGKELNQTSIEEILDIITSNGALDYTRNKARQFSTHSKALIQKVPPSAYREALLLFPDFILYRKK
ncbi:MAG: polyprenyl synthetase family protein [Candidatus Aminicenantales bacterium]